MDNQQNEVGNETKLSPDNQIPTAYTTRTTCRVCNSDKLTFLFTLGDQYINDFPRKEDFHKLRKAPLEMIFCENCSLVQLKHTAPQELLYTGFYWYKSGVTETMIKALKEIANLAEQRFNLQSGDVMLDIGSNDGTLLRQFTVPGLITVGVEPATNLAEEGSKGITHLINDFWIYDKYFSVVGKKAKVITALGMFYDMEDPNQFIADAEKALTDDGVFIAQLMCLKNMLDSNDVGNICHEHLEYYSFASLEYLFGQNGLEIFDIEINNVNGGSYRLYAKKKGAMINIPEGAAERIAQVKEEEKDFQDKKVYQDFFQRLEDNKKRCVDFIKQETAKGKKVWVFGASTKGNVILQYYGLDDSLITAASERSPWKFGRYTVGTNVPIVSEEEARKAQPDYFLVLPYAFFNEMYARETEWRLKGGKWIVPLPEFRVVD
ncbi:methyltransferase domain-containing protein [Candidatus Woesearchaeota archaeon]|jgi:NDP-4-keto-2,6-dideoxyhexose 3-C-methyltransferase|nr:methyltransferase domain-containing protein [Candidatus Woesearchaeota archaeon]MBT5342922.1 methyltransferase domain-containing protein [Candidatus Woesearchaeota archaeon]